MVSLWKKFICLGSPILSSESDVNKNIGKDLTAMTANDKLELVLLYGCTTWTSVKRLEKRLVVNYKNLLCAFLNKSWKQYPKNPLLFGHIPPISQTIHERRARYDGNHWRGKDEYIKYILLWTSTCGPTKVGWPIKQPESAQSWLESQSALCWLWLLLTNAVFDSSGL